jgi:hypothetical protein
MNDRNGNRCARFRPNRRYPGFQEWAASWVLSHRRVSNIASWFLVVLSMAWALMFVLSAMAAEWAVAAYYAVTAIAACLVSRWLKVHSTRREAV